MAITCEVRSWQWEKQTKLNTEIHSFYIMLTFEEKLIRPDLLLLRNFTMTCWLNWNVKLFGWRCHRVVRRRPARRVPHNFFCWCIVFANQTHGSRLRECERSKLWFVRRRKSDQTAPCIQEHEDSRSVDFYNASISLRKYEYFSSTSQCLFPESAKHTLRACLSASSISVKPNGLS